MGGGQALFETNQQYYAVQSDLSKVTYFVYFLNPAALPLIDLNKLEADLSKDISDYLTSRGIKNSSLGPIGGGGGGIETFLDILKNLWNNKDIILFFFSTINFFKILIRKRAERDIKYLLPRVTINISIETNNKVDKINYNELNSILSRNLINLVFISRSLVEYLQGKNTHLIFDYTIAGSINKNKYNVYINVPNEQRKTIDTPRILKILRDIKIKKNLTTQYEMTKWFAISRSDTLYNPIKSSAKTRHNYYLLISNKILRDYFKFR